MADIVSQDGRSAGVAVAERQPKQQSVFEHAPRHADYTLPSCAQAGDVYNAAIGKSMHFSSFEDQLRGKIGKSKVLDDEHPALDERGKELVAFVQDLQVEGARIQGKKLFTDVVTHISPAMREAILEMKSLGIQNDILAPESLQLLAYAIKVDQWGDRPRNDFPQIKETYTPDPDNPLNEIRIVDGKVQIHTLNPNLKTRRLQNTVQEVYDKLNRLKTSPQGRVDPLLAEWIEAQAVSRSMLEAKHRFRPEEIDIRELTFVKTLGEEIQQKSNQVELWQTPDGRKVVVKSGQYEKDGKMKDITHTLQAEVLENRIMLLLGMPVPETTLQEADGMQKLVVGFLDEYKEEKNPFVLSEKYHSSRTLQKGLLVDLWLNDYNRRPHNVMMKDGKVAFIDHGAGAIGRGTGGFKGFSSEIGTVDLWDNLRTIPDKDPNGDVPVNEAYFQVLTVEGGSDGRVVVKDPVFLEEQMKRISEITDAQIRECVIEAGYSDGPDSIAQIDRWLQSDDIKGRLDKLRAIPEDKRTTKDRRDLRWTEGAVTSLENAKAAGGMESYMIQTLLARRNNMISFLTPFVQEAKRAQSQQASLASPVEK